EAVWRFPRILAERHATCSGCVTPRSARVLSRPMSEVGMIREVEYTEGHDISCPYKQRALSGYACFALAGGGAAALALATSCAKAAASFTAISARTLRSSATPATFSP